MAATKRMQVEISSRS